MAFPQSYTQGAINRYQGVIIAEVACMLVFYILLKMIHFFKWGHLYLSGEESEEKKEADTDERKWSQDTWDIYFPIIFSNHIIALALPYLYYPCVFVDVLGFLHMAFFLGMIIVNIFIKDNQVGKGPRTTASRIFWGLMCTMNTILIIVGLSGVPSVLKNA